MGTREGMMGSAAMTDTMGMTHTMPMSGAMMGMGMMGSAEMGPVMDHMTQMMGQMQTMATMCRQAGPE